MSLRTGDKRPVGVLDCNHVGVSERFTNSLRPVLMTNSQHGILLLDEFDEKQIGCFSKPCAVELGIVVNQHLPLNQKMNMSPITARVFSRGELNILHLI
jgi:hypothetical protein